MHFRLLSIRKRQGELFKSERFLPIARPDDSESFN
jgi:hypothetical protein